MGWRSAKYITLSCVLLWGCPSAPPATPDASPHALACATASDDPWTVAQRWTLTASPQALPQAAQALVASWPGAAQLLRVWRGEDGLFYALVGESAEQAKGQALMLELGAQAPFVVKQVRVVSATNLWPALE